MNSCSERSSAITVAGKKFRFCFACRGDDAPLIRCMKCTHPWHFECANLGIDQRYSPGTLNIRKDWKCTNCTDTPDEPRELLTEESREVKRRLQASKNAGRQVLHARKNFFAQIRPLLQPFCDSISLNKLCSDTPTESTVDPVLSESPSYITVQVRNYQLQGINRIFDWYQRGVGGILADEMYEILYI